MYSTLKKPLTMLSAGVALAFSASVLAEHPGLTLTKNDVAQMKSALQTSDAFSKAFVERKAAVDAQLLLPIEVPMPKDAGGGYTHEKHKKNYQFIYEAGTLYQLTGDAKYADHVVEMLKLYADMYPTLGLHPEQKELAPGKLFWQSLNETVWLVYGIQGYDMIRNSVSDEDRRFIEKGLFYPMVDFLSEKSAASFNKVHNHGTWATAGVGMAGYVLNEPEWVEKALYGLDKSGKGGFIKQLDKLFSPQGYYTEGPYYQRYALLPFVTFAKAIEINEPNRKIFEYRDSVLLKAIDTTIQLSYNDLFFPINDSIKDKGIDTIELVHGVAIAYGLTGDARLLDIAKKQDQILLTADGLKVAQALDKQLAKTYPFKSMVVGDGDSGKDGGLVIMRTNQEADHQALVFKATAQGMGHGHFDKLNWIFFDKGEEIVMDYGAARFLNVEAKYGGHYLKENNTYAKQTVAHNTLVVDETSHFNGKVKVANQHFPTVNYFVSNDELTIASATMDKAYKGVEFTRTQALINVEQVSRPFVIDVLSVDSNKAHQYDLPVHYRGQLMDTNFAINTQTTSLKPLGKHNGYEHLWLAGSGSPESDIAKVTWLHNNRFYSHSTAIKKDQPVDVLFTKLGATDPHFNLRDESGFVLRANKAKNHTFVSLLELHGEYNPSKEFTLASHSQLSVFDYEQQGDVMLINAELEGFAFSMAIVTDNFAAESHKVTVNGQVKTFTEPYLLLSEEKSKMAKK